MRLKRTDNGVGKAVLRVLGGFPVYGFARIEPMAFIKRDSKTTAPNMGKIARTLEARVVEKTAQQLL
eukprot:4363948-Amphidinium_carterae.1